MTPIYRSMFIDDDNSTMMNGDQNSTTCQYEVQQTMDTAAVVNPQKPQLFEGLVVLLGLLGMLVNGLVMSVLISVNRHKRSSHSSHRQPDVDRPVFVRLHHCHCFITLERYVKIVHLLIHRKYYRKRMITAAVVICWGVGFISNTPLVYLTAAVVSGQRIAVAFFRVQPR